MHHLLFHAATGAPCDYRRDGANDFAIVATSANRGGEPLIVDDAEAVRELADIADLIVTHDRGIVMRTDNSVMSIIDRAPAFVRRARGFVPDPIDLGADGACILATGGHLKATVTVTRGREAFVSQHIGDLDTAATVRYYEETVRHLLSILDTQPELVACDLHPDFRSTRVAEATGLPIVRVQHHVAHVAAVAAEHGIEGQLIGVALDGHGFGADGGAWGGELFEFNGTDAKRLGHLRPLALPGGDRAAREPWRMGLAALAAVGRLDLGPQFFPEARAFRLAAALHRGSAMPMTTSMGRLFDAAAALAGICRDQHYDGQAAMEFEALCATPRAHQGGFAIGEGTLDFLPLLALLVEERPAPREAAALFHGTLIEGLSAWISAAAQLQGLRHVVLGGGCLMNRVLAEGLVGSLRGRGLMPFIARALPPNDGGLSLGQAAIARSMFSNSGSKGERSLQCAWQFQPA